MGNRYWWPGWTADVARVVTNCLGCQLMDAVFRRRDRLGGHLAPRMPRVAWSLDCAASIKTKTGKATILVMVDDFSKLCILRVLNDLNSSLVTQCFLENVVCLYGRPSRVRVD